jgi:hypothetical protein
MNYRVLLFLVASALGLQYLAPVSISQTTPGETVSKPAVMVELFTSEGCSSCPPADALLAELDKRKSFAGAPIVVLSEHVDYWDHEGWRDPFSSAQWTQRQNGYGERFHLDSVYTPQIVVDGTQQTVGNNSTEVARAIVTAAKAEKIKIDIANAAWSNNSLHADIAVADALPAPAKGLDLYAVLADDEDASSVSAGENSGRKLTHVAVVRVMQKVAALHGSYAAPVRIDLPGNHPHGKMRLIVFAQKGQNGPILGVAQAEV